jgi:hypothetical protein
MTPGCEELRAAVTELLDSYWAVAKSGATDADFDAAVATYFKAQIAFQRQVRGIVLRGSVTPEVREPAA